MALTMMNMRNKLTALVIAVLLIAAMFSITAHAAAPKSPYVGGWNTKVESLDATVEIFDDGTMYVVYSDEPNVGHYFTYVIADDGSLVALNQNDEIVTAFGMYNYNMLLDYDGNAWTRTY
ncbi:MAG: hypothetical protein IJG17_08680 [Eubacterium sp.]|nr:hypothetical protein [Eubacterium sp.]MBQ6362659.1 hypothetical protein [Lachnospiraceae bacterium]